MCSYDYGLKEYKVEPAVHIHQHLIQRYWRLNVIGSKIRKVLPKNRKRSEKVEASITHLLCDKLRRESKSRNRRHSNLYTRHLEAISRYLTLTSRAALKAPACGPRWYPHSLVEFFDFTYNTLSTKVSMTNRLRHTLVVAGLRKPVSNLWPAFISI